MKYVVDINGWLEIAVENKDSFIPQFRILLLGEEFANIPCSSAEAGYVSLCVSIRPAVINMLVVLST